MILLDTNVISALMRETPDPDVIGWLDSQPRTSIWTTSINVFEICFGLLAMPAGKRRTALDVKLEQLLQSAGWPKSRFSHLKNAGGSAQIPKNWILDRPLFPRCVLS